MEHLLDKLIYDYYRICEINNLVNIILDYKIEKKGRLFELTFRVNRKPAGLYCYMSENECKDAVVNSYFVKGLEASV